MQTKIKLVEFREKLHIDPEGTRSKLETMHSKYGVKESKEEERARRFREMKKSKELLVPNTASFQQYDDSQLSVDMTAPTLQHILSVWETEEEEHNRLIKLVGGCLLLVSLIFLFAVYLKIALRRQQ